jgi:2-keto-4-pentenoate hydratase/2-oxohepta-3-ene-1,7-dioic acid hydratase in catechol pathway
MKLVVFEAREVAAQPGILTERGVVGVGSLLGGIESPQAAMQHLIDAFEDLRPILERLADDGPALPLERVRLLAPLPRPGKILCSTGGYGTPPGPERAPLLMTLKSAESVVGPGGVIHLPDVSDEWTFVPQAELGLVIRGPAKRIRADDWRTAVFGYTVVVDVMARGDPMLGRDFWLAKADSLGPLGACIVTADDVAEPNALRVRSWQNGQLCQDYSTADAEYRVPELVEFATTVMTLFTGDVLACGTSSVGPEPLADGDRVEVEIEGIGRLALDVRAMAGSGV